MGYLAQVVEQTIPKTFIKRDLFGFIDIVAIGNGHTLGVQTTSGSNVSARIKKIYENSALPECLSSGWNIVVHGWSLRGKPKRWNCREVEITRDGLQGRSETNSQPEETL